MTTNVVENIDFDTSSFTITNKWATDIMNTNKVNSMLKTNTKYKIIADVTLLSKPETLSPGNSANLLSLYNGTTNISILDTENKNEKDSWQINQKKHIQCEFTTPSSLENYKMLGYCYLTNSAGKGSFKYENVLILEDTETDESFEKYGVMPSTTHSSEIKNCKNSINIKVKNSNNTEQQTITFPLATGQVLHERRLSSR